MQSNSPSVVVVGPRSRRRRPRRFTTGRLVWGSVLRILQRVTHYKHGDHLEFKLNFSVRDLVTDKGRVLKDQVEALVQAVQKAGSYQAKDEATRAVHAVMDALKDRVPPDVFTRLSESSPVREVARLGRAAAQRLQKDEAGVDQNPTGGSEDEVSSRVGGDPTGEDPLS
ncbi:MAG: DUF2267 domain-containing protein [Actinomycetia bacterium]|nr:DUF2267 domain-containing protein [Actinomycetes bacterium]